MAGHKRRVLTFLVLVVAVTIVLTSGSVASLAQTNGLPGARIAFQRGVFESTETSRGSGADGISTIGADGSGRRDLTDPVDASDHGPAWSADGRWVTFYRHGSGEPTVHVIEDAEGTTARELASGWSPQWSPLGVELAWVAWTDEGQADTQVRIAPVDPVSGSVHVDRAEVLDVPARRVWFSPDGRRLAYLVGRDDSEHTFDVWIMNRDGSGRRRVSDRPAGAQTVWSPRGDAIAYITESSSGISGAAVADLVTSDNHVLPGQAAHHLAWHPAGGLLAVSHGSFSDVTIYRQDGEQVTTVHSEDVHDVSAVSWSPDGTELFFVASPGDEFHWENFAPDLYAYSLVARNVRQLTQGQSAFPDGVTASGPGVVIRNMGDSRVATAIALSRSTFSQSHAVVIARADQYADALVGGVLAAHLGAPVLLTHRDGLLLPVAEEVVRLGAEEAWIMGGPAALSEQVDTDLSRAGVAGIGRIAGPTRFDVAAEVARRIDSHAAYLVEGANPSPDRGWPDAVATSALAGAQGRPLLLTLTHTLPEATRRAINNGSIRHITIVGGHAAISPAVEQQVRNLGVTVERIAGADRYATSRALTDHAAAAGLWNGDLAVVTGNNWPDALSAGPAQVHRQGAILLINGTQPDAPQETYRWLHERREDLHTVRSVGGQAAINLDVEAAIERTLRRY